MWWSSSLLLAALVRATAASDFATVYVRFTENETYPGYSGSLSVCGTITIAGTSGDNTTAKQTLTWSLKGLDTACVASAADSITNGCGIHVHTGTSCEVADNVGGHYYSDAIADANGSDPWAPVVYVAASDGSSDESTGVEVITGLSTADISGRVMVVHELASGARIACGSVQTSLAGNPGGSEWCDSSTTTTGGGGNTTSGPSNDSTTTSGGNTTSGDGGNTSSGDGDGDGSTTEKTAEAAGALSRFGLGALATSVAAVWAGVLAA